MTSSITGGISRFKPAEDLVSSDFVALASHMTDCKRSRGRFFSARAVLESLHTLTAPRMVTTGAVLLIFALALLGAGLLVLA